MQNKLTAIWLISGNMYGTSHAAVRNVQKQGRICVLDIEIQVRACHDVQIFYIFSEKTGTMFRFFIFSLKEWHDVKIFHIFSEKMARCYDLSNFR
jgi:hypothetical protein